MKKAMRYTVIHSRGHERGSVLRRTVMATSCNDAAGKVAASGCCQHDLLIAMSPGGRARFYTVEIDEAVRL